MNDVLTGEQTGILQWASQHIGSSEEEKDYAKKWATGQAPAQNSKSQGTTPTTGMETLKTVATGASDSTETTPVLSTSFESLSPFEKMVQVLKDTVLGLGKEAANSVIDLSNMVNKPIEWGLSQFTDFQFGQMEPFEAETPGEEGAMAGTFFLSFFTGAGEGKLGIKLFQKCEMAFATRGRSVLGHYPGYLRKAEELSARRFNVPPHIWEKMSEAERWTANKKFLDRLILRGDEVVLSTPLDQIRQGSNLEREVQYLFSHGYETVNPTLLVPGS